MAWYDTKSAAVDPDNPTADEQFPYSEHNAMVAYLKDKIIGKTVDAAAIGDEKVIAYDLANDKFVFVAQSAVTTLNALTDVVISGVPDDNEVLAYDTATSKFINQTAAEAGLALVANVVLESDFNATTFLYATADDTPEPKNIAETLAILSVESGADVTDATNVDASGAVMESDFDATTFLYATADNTPLPKTRAEVMALLSGTAAAEFLFNTQNIGGIVDPTTAQQAATKNYVDIHLFTKEIVTTFTDGFIPVYRTASGKFEMEAGGESVGLPVSDSTEIVKGNDDGTKRLRFEVDGFTSGFTRVATFPDKNFTVCGTDDALLLAGGTMTGHINMGNQNITGLNELKAHAAFGFDCHDNNGNLMITLATDLYGFFADADASMGGFKLKHVGATILMNSTQLTIASGIVTATQEYHTIDTEGNAASDDLVTINGGIEGQKIIITADDDTRTVVCKDGTGNLQLEGDMSLDHTSDTLSLFYDGSNWLETGRANNGA